MRRSLRSTLLLSLAFGALVFIGLTIYADAGNLIAAFRSFSWLMLAPVLACTVGNYTFRYLKWERYTRVLSMDPGRRNNLIIFFASFMMAITPGKLGEVLKSYMLRDLNGTPVARSAPIILAERLTDFIGLVLIMIAGAFVFGYARQVIAGFAVFFAAVTILLSWRRGSLAVLALIGRVRFLRKAAEKARESYEHMVLLLRPPLLLHTVLLSVAAWAFECLGYWLILHEFQAPPTPLKAAFIYAFSTIVGAVTMLPGGLGSTEGSLTGLAQLAGARPDVAVASTFIIRMATLWFAVVIGVAVTVLFQKKLHIPLDELGASPSPAEH